MMPPEPRTPEQASLFDLPDDTHPAPGGIIPVGSKIAGNRLDWIGHDFSGDAVTESQKEHAIRSKIDRHVKNYAASTGAEIRVVNGTLKRTFGKARDLMTRPELERMIAFLRQNYKVRKVA